MKAQIIYYGMPNSIVKNCLLHHRQFTLIYTCIYIHVWVDEFKYRHASHVQMLEYESFKQTAQVCKAFLCYLYSKPNACWFSHYDSKAFNRFYIDRPRFGYGTLAVKSRVVEEAGVDPHITTRMETQCHNFGALVLIMW